VSHITKTDSSVLMFTEECQSNNKRRKLISLLYVYV